MKNSETKKTLQEVLRLAREIVRRADDLVVQAREFRYLARDIELAIGSLDEEPEQGKRAKL